MTEIELHKRLYPEAAAKKEYIICAAIHFVNYECYGFGPENIETGIVIAGHRHGEIMALHPAIQKALGIDSMVEGFLTSKNQFVDRKEGGLIAFEAGQISKYTDCLFSEDLY